jgi:hypothetical protein
MARRFLSAFEPAIFRASPFLAGVRISLVGLAIAAGVAVAAEPVAAPPRDYVNRLTPLRNPQPLLADYPEFVEPIVECGRFEAPPIVDDSDGDLPVRAWRFSYNARGIIEIPNRLAAKRTAVIVVHPWGIDDGQGWTTPEPAGVALFCTPVKNQLGLEHVEKVVNPFLKRLRPVVKLVGYSLPGGPDPIRTKAYRSIHRTPSDAERREGIAELRRRLAGFAYRGQPLIERLALSREAPVKDYFRQFPSLDAGAGYNNAGFWELPIPVVNRIEVGRDDVVIYDGEGYAALRDFLRAQGVRHVLLAGYATDMCLCATTAGYRNLKQDFNVFIVGDATLATFPAMASPKVCTTAALALASREHLITQVGWVQPAQGPVTGR